MEIPKKYREKNRFKKRRCIWIKIGWGQVERCGRRSAIIIIITGIISAFFPAHGGTAMFIFLRFSFFGKSAGVTPTHARYTARANYAMSTSGRAFKLALIKYWLRVVFSLTSDFFSSYLLYQFVSIPFQIPRS